MTTARKAVARGRPPGSRSADPEIGAAFGQALAAMRLEAGISQESLALAAGVSRANMSAIENGRTTPTFGAVVRISGALGCSVEQLVKEFERRYKRPK